MWESEMWKFFWSFGDNWCIWLSYDIMMHVLRSHDEWSLLDRPRLLPQLPPALKERFGAPEEERLGHVGTPEHIGRLAGIWLSWSTNRHQQIISQRQSIFCGEQSWEFDSPKSSADHLSARHPCVSGSMAKKRPILFRLLVEPREIFQFPSLHYTNVDHCPKICKIFFKLCSFVALLHISKRHEERNIAKWSAVFTVYGIGGDFGAISSDHKLGWIFAISPGSRWHQDWLWRGTRKNTAGNKPWRLWKLWRE